MRLVKSKVRTIVEKSGYQQSPATICHAQQALSGLSGPRPEAAHTSMAPSSCMPSSSEPSAFKGCTVLTETAARLPWRPGTFIGICVCRGFKAAAMSLVSWFTAAGLRLPDGGGCAGKAAGLHSGGGGLGLSPSAVTPNRTQLARAAKYFQQYGGDSSSFRLPREHFCGDG